MDEHRSLPRWKIKGQVNVRIKEEMFGNCRLEDINLQGMCMALPERLSQEGPVRLGLELADGIVIDLDVQVPWVKKMVGYYKHGLVFNGIKDEDQNKISRYMINGLANG